jgi:uncharacterized membrane protein YedE/YeeE
VTAVGLVMGLAGVGLTLAGISVLPDSTLFLVLVVAMLLGAVFVWFDFGFTAGFRAFLTTGDGRVLGASFLIPAIAALVIIPVSSLVPPYSRFVAPIGPSLLFGAALFGVGMQIANGCGSGCLIAAGRGSGRMLVTLPFFCLGGVAGSLFLPTALRLPSLDAVDLPDLLGPWGGLIATEAILLVGGIIVLRSQRPDPAHLKAAALIGALSGLLFLVSGEPWGITMGLTVFGAKALAAIGIDVSRFEFWSDDWSARLLREPALAMHGALSDIGLLLGALLSAALLGRFRSGARLTWRGVAGAATGGILMGVGARLSFGCNIGAFVGGMSSGSIHGPVWFLVALPGCWLGIRLRRHFETSGGGG